MHEWQDKIKLIAKDWLFGDLSERPMPITVILPLENPDLHCHEKFTQHLSDVWHGQTVSIGIFQNTTLGVLHSKFGSPAVAMTVDILAMMGVKNIIGVGYCGSMQKNIVSGDLILPNFAFRNDATTTHYTDDGQQSKPTEILHSNLITMCQNLNIPHHIGAIFSTDAILRESNQSIKKWRNLGAIAVDMEVGTLFSLSHFFNMNSVAILVASDNALLQTSANIKPLMIGVEHSVNLAYKLAHKISR